MSRTPSDAEHVLAIDLDVAGFRAGARVLGFVSASGDAVVSFNGCRRAIPAGSFHIVRLDVTTSEVKPDARAEEYQEAPK